MFIFQVIEIFIPKVNGQSPLSTIKLMPMVMTTITTYNNVNQSFSRMLLLIAEESEVAYSDVFNCKLIT